MEFIKTYEDFLKNTDEGIVITALYVDPPRDSVHVGLFWNWDGDQEIIHFRTHNDIEIADISLDKFKPYHFSSLKDFPDKLIDSLIAVAELISENKLNQLILDLNSVIYKGGKFEISSGKFIIEHGSECFINCGVFVMALLETYDYHLIDWESWPSVTHLARSKYLDPWLDSINVPTSERGKYYNFNKEIRGRHIMACSEFGNTSSKYNKIEDSSQKLMIYLR